MYSRDQIYYAGEWRTPHGREVLELTDPRTGDKSGSICLADDVDVTAAVAAAREAVDHGVEWPVGKRIDDLQAIYDAIRRREDEFVEAISTEMGAPEEFCRTGHLESSLDQLAINIEVLKSFEFDQKLGTAIVAREPIGVVAAITAWNFPLSLLLLKVGTALAAGCSVVAKPSEMTTLSSYLLAEVIDEVGIPSGYFNLLPGYGHTVGKALVDHVDVDMVSFTGSTRAGQEISRAAANSVKRVSLELGGKSPSVILDDLDSEGFERAVRGSVGFALMNCGQTCAAWTRMLLPVERYAEGILIARDEMSKYEPGVNLGPLISSTQWKRVAAYVRLGLEEGATLEYGERETSEPVGGFYMSPKMFGDVSSEMAIAQDEIFGPVLVVQTYRDREEAVEVANATVYGLHAGVWGSEDASWNVARRIRAGTVVINGAPIDRRAPFGGYRYSGNGREYGRVGFEEYLEMKSIHAK